MEDVFDERFHGELVLRVGENRLSSGLIEFNKQGAKAKIFWDKNFDGQITRREKKLLVDSPCKSLR